MIGTDIKDENAMAKFVRDCWKGGGWEKGSQIPGGNQGHTFLARKSTDSPESFEYVLKILKRQQELDRRAMFCAEIRAMEALDHFGVIEVSDTNAERFREDVELYLITPRIAGLDLEARVRQKPFSLEEAVQVTVATLGIVDHCHNRGVLHRDIKPCHVILRRDSLDDPVLIDFGLAYHAVSQPSDAATESGQGRGNRFLVGPEHHTRNPDTKRNTVTDICQCLGLLFYGITSKSPGVLRDEQNRKPHERFSLESLRPDIDEQNRNALLQIFDIGFEWQPDHRWQSISRLVERLNKLLDIDPPSEETFRGELADIMRRAKTDSHTSRFQVAREMTDRLVTFVQSTIAILFADSDDYLSVKCGQKGGHGNKLANMLVVFQHKIDHTRSKAISLVVDFLPDERQIEVSLAPHSGSFEIFPNNQPIRLGRYDLAAPECADDVRDQTLRHLKRCVAEVLGID